jgi:hypothetical protein
MLKDVVKQKPAPRSGGIFSEDNGMAESDNILTKLQDLLVYLSPEA